MDPPPLRGPRFARPEGDIGADVLAMHQVTHADDACDHHGGMLEQSILDFLGRDVRAVMNDELLLAAAEGELALVIGLHEIAGIEPAVTYGLGSGRGILPIAHSQA